MDLRSHRVERGLTLAVVCITTVYLALAIMVPACMSWHGGHLTGSHDQAGRSVHSLFCMWMCQAGWADCLAAASPLLARIPVLLGSAVVLGSLLVPLFPHQSHTRAPPR